MRIGSSRAPSVSRDLVGRNRLFIVAPLRLKAGDWSLLPERESFFALCMVIAMTLMLIGVHIKMGWYADNHLRIQRFGLRAQFHRAGWAFFHVPESK